MKKIILITALTFALTGCWEIGTGNKVGVITKLNKEGLICKTWEAQIIRGGINSGNGAFGQPFNFTVESSDLAEKVQDALDKQKEVKIYYHQEFNSFCRSERYSNPGDGTNYFLDKIEVLENK